MTSSVSPDVSIALTISLFSPASIVIVAVNSPSLVGLTTTSSEFVEIITVF